VIDRGGRGARRARRYRCRVSTPAPSDPLAVVQRYYDAFNAGDWAGMVELLDDQVAHDVNQGERETGRAAFADFLHRMARSYRERLIDVALFTGPGGRVAAEFVVDGTYLAGDAGFPAALGQRYRLPAAAFLEVAAGRITRVTTYYNLAEWLRQVS
jgi:steroid delta-isomerase-like uncharacterized protein